MKRNISILLVFLLIFTIGCVEKRPMEKPEREYIVYNLGKLPQDLIMLDSEEGREKDLLIALFEGLVKTGENGQVIPALASNWTISKDGITYTFKIRENTFWSDGKEIEAQDFVQFFSQILAVEKNNIYAEQLYYIFGAKEYREQKKNLDALAIKALDKKTLVIRLNTPCSYFLDILSQPAFCLRKLESPLKSFTKEYTSIPYSGPFIIQKISESGEVELAKNDRYWEKDAVKSSKILISSIGDSETALAAFETGKVDFLADPPLSENGRLLAQKKANSIPTDNGEGIAFNLQNSEIAKDYNFRSAISYSINRPDLIENVLSTGGVAAETYVPLSDRDNREKKLAIYYEDDISKSKEFLSKSKYDKKKPIKFIYLSNTKNKRVCEQVTNRIQKILEVKVDTIACTQKEWNQRIKDGDYDMAEVEYEGLFNDSISFLEQWTSNSIFNLYGYRNKEYDTNIEKAKLELDSKKRKELLESSEAMLVKDLPIVPLYFDSVILCKSDKIEGIEVTGKGNIRIDRVYKK